MGATITTQVVATSTTPSAPGTLTAPTPSEPVASEMTTPSEGSYQFVTTDSDADSNGIPKIFSGDEATPPESSVIYGKALRNKDEI